jgi:hypothetical protein
VQEVLASSESLEMPVENQNTDAYTADTTKEVDTVIDISKQLLLSEYVA